jgi:predicted permease
METLARDLRFALRSLARRPGFAAVVVVTLALGIGTMTAVFAFAHSILLRPFPYADPDRLVRVFTVLTSESGRETGSSLLDVEDWARESRSFESIGAYVEFDSEVRGDGPAQAVSLAQLNAGALRAPGVQPILGRLFLPEEDRPGGDAHKAVIGHALWRSRFGGDPGVIGRTLRTSLATFTIVGVMPAGFGFPGRADVWTPMESWYAIQVGEGRDKQRNQRWYRVIGRIRPGFSLPDAEAELNGVAAALEARFPADNAGVRVRLRSLREAETGEIRPYLRMIAAAAGLVLLICCVNVAGLLVSRAVFFRRESGVRAALGASRGRLMQASLIESLVLALAGGALGVGVAFGSVRLLLGLIPVDLPSWMRIEVDPAALAFALLLALLTTLLFGLTPALMLSRSDPAEALKEDTRTGTGGGARLRGVLVVSEICLTLLLLIGAGLLTQTFLRLRNQETGFDPEGLLVARATNYRQGTRAERAAALSQFHGEVLDELRALPGVESASGTNALPYTRTTPERTRMRLRVRGLSEEETRLFLPVFGADVSPGFLETMNIRLVQGRSFDGRDAPTSPMVVIVNERAARILWPDRDPIGRELYWGTGDPTPDNPYCRVVGVVEDVRTLAGEPDDGLELYYPYTQYPITNIYYVLRTRGDPRSFIPAVRRTIQTVDQDAAIVFVKTMDRIMNESLWQRRLWSVLLSAFGALSLLLAAVGIYGMLSFLVAQRTREIGVRIALGARPAGILALVLGQGARLLALGLGLGLAGGLALRRLLSAVLFGVSATDPPTLAGAVAVLSAVTILACYLPARRASAIDPLAALRHE